MFKQEALKAVLKNSEVLVRKKKRITLRNYQGGTIDTLSHSKKKSTGFKEGGFVRCADTHPPLKIKTSKGDRFIYGGSCLLSSPRNYDIFIGLDSLMKVTDKTFPWTEGVQFLYAIQDMGVPKNIKSFYKLLGFLKVVVLSNKKVFVGCIGGHGRTGLVLSALVAEMTGKSDAITYVRKNYCKKAVETAKQINWLVKHFGVQEVTALRIYSGAGSTYLAKHTYPPKTEVSSSYTQGYCGSDLLR